MGVGGTSRVLVAAALLALVMVACSGGAEKFLVTARVVTGPNCSGQQAPSSANCDDTPVDHARVDIVDREGHVVATAETNADGWLEVSLEEGSYRLRPHNIDGLSGIAEPLDILVTRGGVAPLERVLIYDTGIR